MATPADVAELADRQRRVDYDWHHRPGEFVCHGRGVLRASPVGRLSGRRPRNVEGRAPIDIEVFLRVSAAPQVALNVAVVNIAGTAGSQISVLLPLSSTTVPSPIYGDQSRSITALPDGCRSLPASGNTGTAGGTPVQVTLTANLTAVPAGLHYAVVNFHRWERTPAMFSAGYSDRDADEHESARIRRR